MPDGWVLVPREPTQAMLLAEDLALADDWDSNQFAWGRASWAAMLAASPTPAAVASGEPTKRMRITQRDGTSRVLPYDPQFVLDHDETMEVIDEATELARSAAAKGEG